MGRSATEKKKKKIHSMPSPLNEVETREVSGYVISFTLVTTNGLKFIPSFIILFPDVSYILSYQFIVTNR